MIGLHIERLVDASPTLVLIHAFPLSARMYDEAVNIVLQRSDLNIILVDLPGFGSAPSHQGWTISGAAHALHTALRTHGVMKPIICGTSIGGYTALAFYRLFPDEVGALILSNTKAEADTPDAKLQRKVFADDVLARGYDAVYMRMLPKLVAKSLADAHPDVIERLRMMIAEASPQAIADALNALALRDDSTDLLTSVSVPTLVIAGNDDELIPPIVSKTMAEHIPNAQYRALDLCGHLSAFEMPAEWSNIVSDFLLV